MKATRRTTFGPQAGRRRWGRAQQTTETDPYKPAGKLPEPSVCTQCGAVHHEGRWRWSARPESAHEVLCPACRRINDGFPAGVITLIGAAVQPHKEEMIRLARHQEETEKTEHPLNRIMSIEESGDRIVIATTDTHLARRIGDAQKRAFHGKLESKHEEDGSFVRVTWRSDS